MVLAVDVSMPRMTPWAWLERTIQAYAWLGRVKSSVYLPLPRSRVSSSLRRTGCPTPYFCSAMAFSSEVDDVWSCIEICLKCRLLRDFTAFDADNLPRRPRQRLFGHGCREPAVATRPRTVKVSVK